MNTRNALNFSGGPGALPEIVLRQVQTAIIAVPEVGLSILGISHRSDWFAGIVRETEENIRALLNLPEDFHILFLQGGATQQFSQVPMTLLRGRRHAADYLDTGYWSRKVIAEAMREGPVRVVWSGERCGYRRLPREEELTFSPDAPYLHYVSNETVEGLQFHRILGRDDVPRVCDMSSDFLSKPCQADKFSLIYAHAQKNIGPAGVTIVLVRDNVVQSAPQNLPAFLDYRRHVEAHSNLNTPPVFAIYVVLLVTRWLRDQIGGLDNMARINHRKAQRLHAAIDDSDGFYRHWGDGDDRSDMNVAFSLPDAAREKRFFADASLAGFSGLEGHRALGGARASIYNALEPAAVERLVEFLDDFRRRNPR
ncbi:phosphoserine transaminase [Martelella alba]|uniref:Phosphoserine aminotransferase n=1 Tax=Martelella alba TaxID=2590451 RepID=A0ABY2SN15_9HYPH|nr:phosphoserine transaminase [Martelella alba]